MYVCTQTKPPKLQLLLLPFYQPSATSFEQSLNTHSHSDITILVESDNMINIVYHVCLAAVHFPKTGICIAIYIHIYICAMTFLHRAVFVHVRTLHSLC